MLQHLFVFKISFNDYHMNKKRSEKPGPTKKLVDIIERNSSRHKRVLKPKIPELRFRISAERTPSLFKNIPVLQLMALRQYGGTFFQVLAKAIFGGAETDKVNNCMQYLIQGRKKKFAPDLTNFNTETFREVKGVCATESSKFRDFQMNNYARLLTYTFPFENPKLSFTFCRYNIRRPASLVDMTSAKACEDSILEMVQDNCSFILDLSFPVVLALYFAGTRYDGEKFDTLARFSSRQIDGMFEDPKKTLGELKPQPMPGVEVRLPLFRSGISLEDVVWRRYKLAQEVCINGRNIKSPLILKATIPQERYVLWLDSFREECDKSKKEHPEDYNNLDSGDFLRFFRLYDKD